MSLYARKISDEWKSGHNVVFGAEAIDYVVSSNVNANKILKGILGLMPWNDNNIGVLGDKNAELHFVVTHRSPRADHLVSLWHQLGEEGQSLSDFILNDIRHHIFKIDSLALANRFARHGLKTFIINTDGLAVRNVDLSSAVACDILMVPCLNGSIAGAHGPPKRINVKSGKGEMNLDEAQLKKVDEILHHHDCSFQHLSHHQNVTILYPYGIFQACSLSSAQIPSLQDAVGEIQRIVKVGALLKLNAITSS